MSQNDLSIANQGFASFRSDLNSALQALGSTNSGTSAPSTTYANQLFYDTTNNILKIRNEDNDAFISLFTLDQSNDNIESLTINGALSAESLDLNGGELILDADNDTSITADTDDQIDFKTGGTDVATFTNSSSTFGGQIIKTVVDTSTNGGVAVNNGSYDAVAIGTGGYSVNGGATTDGGMRAYNNLVFGAGSSSTERMRIEGSSGNVLVGRTSTINGGSNSASGAQIGSNGLIQSAVSGDTAISLQRLSGDGDIIQLRKDTTPVGSIGSLNSGRDLHVNSSGGILTLESNFNSTERQVVLGDSYFGVVANDDNAVDLGRSSARYKNLYLSGGIYVGGTGSANFLDDYEEGSFTPTTSRSGYTISESSGTYTKVGRLVNLFVRMVFSSIGSSNSHANCNNFPFVKASGIHNIGVGRETSTNGAIFVSQMTQNTNVFSFNSMDGIGNNSQEAFQANKAYIFHIAFET